jgi:hypothetical protein
MWVETRKDVFERHDAPAVKAAPEPTENYLEVLRIRCLTVI